MVGLRWTLPLVTLLAASAGTQVAFTRVSDTIGLTDTYTNGNTHTGGSAWVDYNNDFWPDLFITNGSGLPHHLYRNNGDGTFTDVSSLVLKPDIMLEDAGVIFADIENDGDADILVMVDNPSFSLVTTNPPEGGPNLLYLNQGGTFTEGAAPAGLVHPAGRRTIDGGFADYDRDGFVDVYLASWNYNNDLDAYDRLMRNLGNGVFTDVTDDCRVDGYGRWALTTMWFDLDLDGWQDLYVGTIGEGSPAPDNYDIIYRFDPCTERFCDATGDPHVIGDDAFAAMGLDVGDIDNDGDWDLYLTDLSAQAHTPPPGNVLYVNQGDGRFADNTCDVAGVCGISSWPCNFFDVNLDGRTDLWVGTGGQSFDDFMYVNVGNGTFVDFSPASFSGNRARGGSIADYDGDGDVDIFVWNLDDDSVVLRNDTGTSGNWLEVKLFGVQSNASAIGATVRVTANGITQMRRVSGGDSAHSQSDLIVHFGLGAQTQADVTVDWPNGAFTDIGTQAANQLLFIAEDTGLLTEQLTFGKARYDAASQRLLVEARTSFGGRSSLDVADYGVLPYEAARTRFIKVFEGVSAAPPRIEITSSSGASFELQVEIVVETGPTAPLPD